jgi:hypothetical protein
MKRTDNARAALLTSVCSLRLTAQILVTRPLTVGDIHLAYATAMTGTDFRKNVLCYAPDGKNLNTTRYVKSQRGAY